MPIAPSVDRFDRVVFAEGSDPRFHFQLAVPKGCMSVAVDAPPDTPATPFVRFGRFVDPTPPGIEIDVYLGHLARELKPADVVALDLERAGATVSERHTRPGSAGRDAVISAELPVNGVTSARRVRVVRDGCRLFRVDVTIPKPVMSDEDMAIVPLASFRLLHPEGSGAVEHLLEYRATDPRQFRFRYPGSWSVIESAAPPGGASVRIEHGRGDRTLGSILVECYDPRQEGSLTRHCRAYGERLRSDGVRLLGSPIVPVPPPPGFSASHLYAPTAFAGGRPLAIAALAIGRPGASALIALVCPTGDDLSWLIALNRRAFEIVLDTFALDV